MSTITDKLGLIKLELTDVADITAMNQNWERLDNLSNDDVDAAPAGFGLGTHAVPLGMYNNADLYTNCGWYEFNESTKHAPTGMKSGVIHSSRYETDDADLLIVQDATDDQGTRERRVCDGGSWGEWEYENPPMKPGAEYRTTERKNGKAVYKMLDASGNVLWRTEGEETWKPYVEAIGGIAKADKPTGSYAGNGSATWRTIDIGGTGFACMISGHGYMALVTNYGAIVKKGDMTTINSLTYNDIAYNNGVLTIATDSESVNANGQTYYYQVL